MHTLDDLEDVLAIGLGKALGWIHLVHEEGDVPCVGYKRVASGLKK